MLLKLTQGGEATSNPSPEVILAVQPSSLPFSQAAPQQAILALPLPDAVSPVVTSPAPIDHVASPNPEDAKLGGKRGHTTDSGGDSDSDISEAVPVKRTRKKKNLIEDLSSDEEAQEKAESKRIEAMLKDGKEAQVTGE